GGQPSGHHLSQAAFYIRVNEIGVSTMGDLPEHVLKNRAKWDLQAQEYVAPWLARRGARVVGIDNSQAQLVTARRLQQDHGLDFPLIHGNAESVPYPDASFDLAISEYGACLWADPERWVAEAARLLRADGQLIFLTNSFLLMLCAPAEEGMAATDRLLRPAFGMYRVEWPGDQGVEFHLSHSEWIRRLRRFGFEIEDMVEIRPPAGATS